MHTKKPITLFLLLVLASVLSAVRAGAQAANPAPASIFEFLTQEEGARLTLETDFTTIIAQKKSNDYYPGTLTTEDGRAFSVELRRRGRFRRAKADLPPLKIKIPKKQLVSAGFDTLNEIKLVLPWADSEQADEWIIREYLTYRMFERLTPVSMRARLIRLSMRDTHVEKYKRSVYAILVEGDEFACARLNAREVEQYGIHPDSLMMNQAALVAMFQYMIGNTDWDISMARNVRLIRGYEPDSKVAVLPYDFDFSGFVHTTYAVPNSETGLKHVRQRFLMANGLKPEALRLAVKQLRAAKSDLYAICRSKHLSRSSVQDLIEYLETFFQAVETSDEVPAMMVD